MSGRSVAYSLIAKLLAVIAVGFIGALISLDQARGAQIAGGDGLDESLQEPVRDLNEGHCEAIEIQAAHAEPLQTLVLSQWPGQESDNWGTLVVRLETGGEQEVPAPVVLVDFFDGEARVPVPVHPTGDPQGGEVRLRFGQLIEPDWFDPDDTSLEDARWCEQHHVVTIDPLPEADPRFGLSARIDLLDEWYQVAAELGGTELDALLKTPREEVPREHAMLYAGATILRHPEGMNAQVAGLDKNERELVDRLLTQAALLAGERSLPEEVDIVHRSDTAMDHTGRMAGRVSRPTRDSAFTGSGLVASIPDFLFSSAHAASSETDVPVENGQCQEVSFDELAEKLGLQFSGRTMIAGDPGRLLDMGVLLVGVPGTGLTGVAVSTFTWLTRTVSEYLAGAMPALESNQSEVLVSAYTMREDDVDGGMVEEVALRFESRGWDAGPRLAELAVMGVSSAVTSGLQKAIRATPDPRSADTSKVVGTWVFDTAEALEKAEAAKNLNIEIFVWLAETLIGFDPDESEHVRDLLIVGADCWEARALPPDWHPTIAFEYERAVEEGYVPEQYFAAGLGTGTVQASWEFDLGEHVLQVPWQKESFVVPLSAKESVEVRRIRVHWTPLRERAQPGEEIALRLRIDQAHDGRVKVTDALGTLEAEVDAHEEPIVGYRVPDDWDTKEPIRILATSLSDDGLRHPDHPGYSGERTGSAWVLFERPRPEIFPTQRCLEPGSRLTLDVVDARQVEIPLEVNWSAEGGAIGPDGTLHAPMEPGAMEVTATPVDSPEAATTASFEVGDCSACDWTLQAHGETYHGDTIALVFIDRESGGAQVIMLRGHDQVFRVHTDDGQGSDASYAVHTVPPRFDFYSDDLTPYRTQLSLEWSRDTLRNALTPGVDIQGSGRGAVEVKFRGRFHPPVYKVSLRSPNLIDEMVRERWFTDAEAGDHFHYFDRQASMLECGGDARTYLEANDYPTWPDHQVPLHGFEGLVEDDPALFYRGGQGYTSFSRWQQIERQER